MKRCLLVGLLLIGTGLIAAACAPATTSSTAAGPQVVQVKMGEFYFKPQAIRLKAGQQVRIEIVNEGKIEHEFMLGREVEMEGGKPAHYEKDFFDGIQVSHTEEKGEFKLEPMHGTEVELDEGGKATLSFTVPTDRKGNWEVGCFAPGHYEAGMKGVLVVE